jgi:hypothetical protein
MPTGTVIFSIRAVPPACADWKEAIRTVPTTWLPASTSTVTIALPANTGRRNRCALSTAIMSLSHPGATARWHESSPVTVISKWPSGVNA